VFELSITLMAIDVFPIKVSFKCVHCTLPLDLLFFFPFKNIINAIPFAPMYVCGMVTLHLNKFQHTQINLHSNLPFYIMLQIHVTLGQVLN